MAGLKRITDLPAASTLIGDELLEVSQLSTSETITATTISAQASDNSYNDSASGFVTAGFAVNDRVRVTGFTGSAANNILVGVITALTAGKMTIGGTDGDVIVDDAAGETVTIAKWTSKRISVAAMVSASSGDAIDRITVSGTTLTLTDAHLVGNVELLCTNAAGCVITIPTGLLGTEPCLVSQEGAAQVTIAASGTTLHSAEGKLKTRVRYSTLAIDPRGSDTFNIFGDITT